MEKDLKNDDFELHFYEGLIEKSPHFVQALIALGDLYTKQGQYSEGLAVDEKLVKLKPDDPYVFYNLACSYSLLKKTDAALEAIKTAINLGYNDFDFLEKDEDLAHLCEDDAFIEYYVRLKRKLKSRKKE